MPADVAREATTRRVTPEACKGALGTWRSRDAPGHRVGIERSLNMTALDLFRIGAGNVENAVAELDQPAMLGGNRGS